MNHNSLTPAQQTDFEHATANAIIANDAFDRRKTAAIDQNSTAFEQAQRDFDVHQKMAALLMPPRSSFEASDPIEPFAAEAVWNAMTPEQRTKAAEQRGAIVAGELKEYGVTEDSLRIVMTEKDDQKAFHLVHTGNGIDIGDPKKDYDRNRSYKAVMSAKNNNIFKVEVDGVVYDTRSGMTDAVYAAKVADAKARGVTLPDSKQLSEETGDIWTWTMLTGEKLTAGGRVPVRDVGQGEVYRNVYRPVYDYRALRVCPAVEVK